MFRNQRIRHNRTGRGVAGQAVIVVAAALALALTACANNSAADRSDDTVQPAAPASVESPMPTSASKFAITPPGPVGAGAPATSSAGTPTAADPSTDPDTDTAASPDTATDITAGTAADSGISTPTASTQRSAPAQVIDNAVTITMPGMSYQVSGVLRPGVGSITLVNSDDVAHMMSFGRLKDGVDLKQAIAALRTGEDALVGLLADSPDTSYGTPGLLGAGQSETVTALDIKPGHYILACFLTAADGTPHWQMGMVGELDVQGDPATDKPASDGTITIDDSHIAFPDAFTGRGTFLVTNSGRQPHNISIAKLDSNTTLAQYAGHVAQAMGTGAPIDGGGGVLVSGIDALAPGQSAYVTMDLPAGHYGYISSEDMTGPDLPALSGELTLG